MKKSKNIIIKTFVISLIFMILCCFFLLFPNEVSQAYMSCIFDEVTFEEYREIIATMAETEEYPHYLEANSQRYVDYLALNPDISFDLVIAHVNAYLDKEPYVDIQPAPDPYRITVLVNKIFMLSPDWSPDDFADIGGGHMMRDEAAGQFILMREEMQEDGLNLTVVIAHRTYNAQQTLYNNAVARQGRASADAGFARPGHSEHQTGLAADVLHRAHSGGLMIHQGFENSQQFTWLVENAHNYGFILRYPDGYRNLSGFIFEPWHWRYVGVSIATAMYNEEIALYEEFYGRFLAQGVRDKVNDWVIEQRALAEAAEAARIAEEEAAAAEAARIAEEEAAEAARIAAETEATEKAAAEEAAKIAAEEEVARIAAEEEAARIHEATSSKRHILELLAVINIGVLVFITYLIKKKN